MEKSAGEVERLGQELRGAAARADAAEGALREGAEEAGRIRGGWAENAAARERLEGDFEVRRGSTGERRGRSGEHGC